MRWFTPLRGAGLVGPDARRLLESVSKADYYAIEAMRVEMAYPGALRTKA
ncbi:hypothetical protein GCM10009838_70970 [Catenulispora subtropica]|uniref:Uncharacterized protein n=1 Tax=Catenulispora subtropica TaxID=450798 RepID=A0ABP5EDB5_9ACTN